MIVCVTLLLSTCLTPVCASNSAVDQILSGLSVDTQDSFALFLDMPSQHEQLVYSPKA